jgi:hypothetical protein
MKTNGDKASLSSRPFLIGNPSDQCEISGFYSGEDSSRGVLGYDVV